MASFLRMGLWGVMLSSETPRTHGCRSSGCGCSRDKNRSTNHAELLWLGGRPAGVSSVVVELLVARQSLQCRCENLMAGTWPGPSQASPGTVALPPCSPLTSRLLTCLVAASLLATSDLRWEALNQAVFRPKMSPRPTSVSACVCRETLNVDRQSSEPGPQAVSKGLSSDLVGLGLEQRGPCRRSRGQPKQSSPSPAAPAGSGSGRCSPQHRGCSQGTSWQEEGACQAPVVRRPHVCPSTPAC